MNNVALPFQDSADVNMYCCFYPFVDIGNIFVSTENSPWQLFYAMCKVKDEGFKMVGKKNNKGIQNDTAQQKGDG